jgi:hypothetical protein
MTTQESTYVLLDQRLGQIHGAYIGSMVKEKLS